MAAVVTIESRRTGAASTVRRRSGHLELYRPPRPGADLPRAGVPGAGVPSAGVSRSLLSPRPAARRLDPTVYRRRRLLAAGLFLLAIAAVLVLAQLIQAGIGGGPLTTTGAAAGPGMIPAGTTEYVVRPGDTLWSIAAQLAPGRDERPLVDQLAKQTHGASLYPGQVIALPGH